MYFRNFYCQKDRSFSITYVYVLQNIIFTKFLLPYKFFIKINNFPHTMLTFITESKKLFNNAIDKRKS
jgi:hypothetical protein